MEFSLVEAEIVGLLESGRLQQAEEKLLPFCGPSSSNGRALFLLGAVKHHLGELAAALPLFERAVQNDPSSADFRNALGAVLSGLGRPHDALRAFRKALHYHPKNPLLLVNIAITLESLGDRRGALEHYERALRLDPGFRPALQNRGALLAELGRFEAALANNDVLVQSHPDWVEAHFCRAEALLASGRYGQALESYERALQLDANHFKARFGRAVALSVQGEFAAAAESFEALRLVSGTAYQECLKRARDAVDSEAALPDTIPELIYLFGMSRRQDECDWKGRDAFVRYFQEWIDRGEPFLANRGLPFRALSLPIGARRQGELNKMASSQLADMAGVPLPPVQRRRNKKIRIGYVSPDFRFHPLARLSRPLFHLHDRNRFEIYAYSLSPDDGSALHHDIRGASDRFFDVVGMDGRALAGRIRSDEVDILVDMAGHAQGNRLDAFALRPAPVQVAYLGFPATTGADFIDYLVTDAVVSPYGSECDYSEKLVRLPRSYLVYDSEQAVAPSPTRQEVGLPENGTVFCCFNNPSKIGPEVFSCWMRMLKRVPGSVLWLFQGKGGWESNLLCEAERQGVDSDRIRFAPLILDSPRHLARYSLADLFLDTPICNAHTTAADALWAGLPVLTCPGDSHGSRVAASLLASVGMAELAVESLDAYMETAVRLGSHPEEVAALKAKLAVNRDRWPLFDTRSYVGYLEQAYLAMWERYQAGQPPQSFNVPA